MSIMKQVVMNLSTRRHGDKKPGEVSKPKSVPIHVPFGGMDLHDDPNVVKPGSISVVRCNNIIFFFDQKGAAVAEWLSSWLAEQEDRGSIPGLATWIFRDWLSPASKSRYGWKIAKSTLILKTTNQPNLWPEWSSYADLG